MEFVEKNKTNIKLSKVEVIIDVDGTIRINYPCTNEFTELNTNPMSEEQLGEIAQYAEMAHQISDFFFWKHLLDKEECNEETMKEDYDEFVKRFGEEMAKRYM